ncbi:MAG: Autotransporter adhesin [Labilithrix sp.]|nr:Autotransporter adhesin [Labilithrix sp.]
MRCRAASVGAALLLSGSAAACSLISLDPYTRGERVADDAGPAVDAEADTSVSGPPEAGADVAPLPSPYRDAVMADKPTAYYRFGEAAGASQVVSETGIAIRGVLAGGATLGKPGALARDPNGALLLDGTSGSVSFGNVFSFPLQAAYSIEIWARPDVITDAYSRIFNRDVNDAKGRQGYTLVVENALGIVAERIIDDHTDFLHRQALTAGVWFHAVVTYDKTTFRLFVDGVLAQETPSPPDLVDSSSAFVVGSAPAAFGFFAGAVDELAIYDRALEPARIAEHHRVGAGL